MTTVEDTKTLLGRRTLLAMAASAIALPIAAPMTARAEAADLVDLQVVDRDTGQPARVWRHAGRLFVAGRPGARYSLRVSNNTAGRVLAVMSVDGVNILTGETAAYGQRGYIFGPYESYDVSGWRKSDTEVAAFVFAALSRSYAARTGRPGDVGVIGVAAFTERAAAPRPVAPAARAAQPRDQADSAEATAAGGRFAPAPPPAGPSALAEPAPMARRSEKLGTAHGEREWSQVSTVAFERATAYPQLIRRLEYDSTENLLADGVIPPPRRPLPPPRPRPRPFPSSDSGGYVPDPPGWR